MPDTATVATTISAVLAAKTLGGAKVPPVGPGAAAASLVVEPLPSSSLNFGDPRLPAALAVVVKAHMEAVPAEADAIKARGFALKTVGDLAQYHADITPIIAQARTAARQQKLFARKQRAAVAGPVTTIHATIKSKVVGA